MRSTLVVQVVGLVLTVLFMGLFLLDKPYFVTHHLLAAFAVVMTLLAEFGIYLAKKRGEITPRNALLSGILILLMLMAALYIDHVGSHVFSSL